MKKYIIRFVLKDAESFSAFMTIFLSGFAFAVKCVGRGEVFNFTYNKDIIIKCNDDRVISCVRSELSNYGLIMEDFE